MKLNEINIRDPFVLPFDGKYYMYGSRGFEATGFDVYVSSDLENWSEPKSVFEYFDGFWATKEFWAPEVHIYDGKFFMFASFKSETKHRGTQILVADSPLGPFSEHSVGAVTPSEWECLDGTLYLDEDNKPYMVFCHEWTQIKNGTVCAVELSYDLKEAVSEPKVLWHGNDAFCFKNFSETEIYITDGPFLLKADGELVCLWSSISNGAYMELIARSDNGKMDGNWSVDKKALFEKDGGHGMIFKTFDDAYKFTYHCPNTIGKEHPCIIDIKLLHLKENNIRE